MTEIDHLGAPPLRTGKEVITHIQAHTRSVLEEEVQTSCETHVAIWEQGDDAFTTPVMDTFFIALVLSGEAAIDLDFDARSGRRCATVSKGSLCTVPAGNATKISFEGRVRVAHLMLSGRIVADALADAMDAHGPACDPAGFVSEHHPELAAACIAVTQSERIEKRNALRRSEVEHRLAARLVRYIYSFARDDGDAAWSISDVQLKQAVDYIDERVFEDFRLEEVAGFVRCEALTLLRAFEVEIGSTPSQFLAERRVDHIKEWLRVSRKFLASDLAEMAGFRSVEAMDNAFRSVLGISFERYRRGQAI